MRRGLPTIRGVAVLLALGLVAQPGWAQAPAFPQYQSQSSATTFMHSSILTSDNKAIWDFQFARLVKGAIANGYAEIAFAFMQCFGGGMIDELTALNLVPAAYTAAARHDQSSWATPLDVRAGADGLFPDYFAYESSYNIHYAPLAGGAPGGRTPQTQRTAAGTAYNLDVVGQGPGNLGLTIPQYTSSGPMGDSITLHNPNPNAPVVNPRYRGILFGGSTQFDGPADDFLINARAWAGGAWSIPANWESLTRIDNALLAAAYLPNEYWAAYTGGPGGPGTSLFPFAPGNAIRVPVWVFSNTRAADLKAAFTWLGGQTNASTQIFYWNSYGHGSRGFDFIGWLRSKAGQLLSGVPFQFTLDSGFTAQLQSFYDTINGTSGETAPGSPDLKISTTAEASFSVALDGTTLAPLDAGDIWGDGTEFQYTFELTSADVSDLAAGGTHTLTVTVNSGPPNALSAIEFLGFTTGDVPPDLYQETPRTGGSGGGPPTPGAGEETSPAPAPAARNQPH